MVCLVARIELVEETVREKERESTVKTRKVSASINSDDRDVPGLTDRSGCRSLDSRLVTSPMNDGMH